MGIKFIDKNRKNEICGDEIIARCSCGCGLLSVKAFKALSGVDGKRQKILSIEHFGNSVLDTKKAIASSLYYTEEAIGIIMNLISGKVNDGNGVIEDLDGSMLMIEHDTDKDYGESIVIAGFYDERSFRKYMKNPEKGTKYLAWNIHLEEKEYKKFAEAIENLFVKEFDYEVLEKDDRRSDD